MSRWVTQGPMGGSGAAVSRLADSAAFDTRPNSINTYASKPFPQHCLAKVLPSNETRVKNSNGALSGSCFQLPLRAPHERQPVPRLPLLPSALARPPNGSTAYRHARLVAAPQVLPTLFIPGFPKAATSWLWESWVGRVATDSTRRPAWPPRHQASHAHPTGLQEPASTGVLRAERLHT